MPLYRVIGDPVFLQPDGYAGPAKFSAGAEFHFSGLPGMSLMPLDEEARAAKFASVKSEWHSPGYGFHMRVPMLAKSLGSGDLPNMEAYRNFVDLWLASNAPTGAPQKQRGPGDIREQRPGAQIVSAPAKPQPTAADDRNTQHARDLVAARHGGKT